MDSQQLRNRSLGSMPYLRTFSLSLLRFMSGMGELCLGLIQD